MQEKHFYPKFRTLFFMVDQQISASLEDVGLTCSQGHIMGFVSHQKEPPCPRDVEEAFDLSHPTVSGLLARLEKKGFLELTPDERDRRYKRIRMLPKGREYMDRLHMTIRETEAKIVAGLTPEEQEAFAGYLDQAIRNLGGCPRNSNCNHKEESMK